MIDHTGIGVGDVARSAAFYLSALAAGSRSPRTRELTASDTVWTIQSFGLIATRGH
jgi:hypothetical protein